MKTIEETIEFIKKAHEGVLDMGKKPYWEHPFRVMRNLGEDATLPEKLAALLHDTVEDVDWITYDYLRGIGYSEEVIDIIKLVTKEDGDYRPYHVWIKAIVDSGNVSAVKVKKADMIDNKDPDRLKELDVKTRKRLERKYDKGWKVIMEFEKTYEN